MNKQGLIDFILNRKGTIIGREVFECPTSAGYIITQIPAWGKGETLIDLIDDFGCGIAIFSIGNELCHYFANEDEIWNIQVDGKEQLEDWMLLTNRERETIERFLKLLAIYQRNPDELSFKEKKWLLANADCKSHLCPSSLTPIEFNIDYVEEEFDKKFKEVAERADAMILDYRHRFNYGFSEEREVFREVVIEPLKVITIDGIEYIQKEIPKDIHERLKKLTDASGLPEHLGQLFCDEIKRSTDSANKHLRDRLVMLGLA